MLLFGNLALPLSLTSFHHWLFWLWFCFCSLSSPPPALRCGKLTAPRFTSSTSNATTRFAPLRVLGLLSTVVLQQRGLLFVRSGFTPSGLGDSLPLRFVGGLQHHCVILCHGVILWFVQHRCVVIDPRVSLCRLTSLPEIFASCAARFARLSCRCHTLLPFTCADDSSLSLSCTRAAIPTILHFAIRTVFLVRPSSSAFTFCTCLFFFSLTWLCASWSTGTPRLRHVCTDRPVYTSGGALLVLQALLAPVRRLPSCLCTWRLARLWTDVRIFLHLCILGACRWDSIKDLNTWLALPLQHDWNIHNSVCKLPPVSVRVGSLALVFALHGLRDFNHLVGGLAGFQPSSASSESSELVLRHN